MNGIDADNSRIFRRALRDPGIISHPIHPIHPGPNLLHLRASRPSVVDLLFLS